jgi:hypothetical protein
MLHQSCKSTDINLKHTLHSLFPVWCWWQCRIFIRRRQEHLGWEAVNMGTQQWIPFSCSLSPSIFDVPIRREINQDQSILQLDCDLISSNEIIYSSINLVLCIYSYFSIWYKHLAYVKYHPIGWHRFGIINYFSLLLQRYYQWHAKYKWITQLNIKYTGTKLIEYQWSWHC